MNTTRVILVDDHPVVRQGLLSLLSQYPTIEVVGEASSNQAAMELITKLKPDVILLDIRLAGHSGLDLAQQLRRLKNKSRIIVLTSHDDAAYMLEAAQMGVHGYLLKSASPEVLVEAIKAVQRGEHRLSPDLAGKALEQLQALTQFQAQNESGLTEQEIQLLNLLADGASTHEIAQALYLSVRTVKRKIQDVSLKLGAANRTQMVAEAYKRGIL